MFRGFRYLRSNHCPADALLSANTTVQDVFTGFYKWLDTHPTETLLISLKVDNGPTDAALQQEMFELITTGRSNKYWSQLPSQVG